MGTFLFLLFNAIAQADCPSESLDDHLPHTIHLSKEQASCTASQIFQCNVGNLRESGSAVSLDKGTRHLTVFCRGGPRFKTEFTPNAFEESEGLEEVED